jgi:chromosome segregation ATPase
MVKNISADEKLQNINKKLYEVSEKQVQNQRDLITNEQSEQHFLEISRKYNRLFDRLFYTWNKDKTFANWLNQENTELLHHKQKITYELENQRETLNHEKRRLNDLEDELYGQKRSLLREVK